VSRPAASEQKCLDAIRAAGTIRTAELAIATGIGVNNLTTALAKAISRGDVYVCKVSGPNGGRSTNEYRIGGGMAPPAFTPLNTRRTGVALTTNRSPATPPPSLSTPKSVASEIVTPVLINKPQPAVGNTGSTRSDSSTIPAEARAVTAQATPRPAPQKLKSALPPAKASAGDVIELPKLSIDQDGRLQLGDTDDPARYVFTPEQTLAIGDFLHATQGVWRA
jgi:hypothetical protein